MRAHVDNKRLLGFVSQIPSPLSPIERDFCRELREVARVVLVASEQRRCRLESGDPPAPIGRSSHHLRGWPAERADLAHQCQAADQAETRVRLILAIR